MESWKRLGSKRIKQSDEPIFKWIFFLISYSLSLSLSFFLVFFSEFVRQINACRIIFRFGLITSLDVFSFFHSDMKVFTRSFLRSRRRNLVRNRENFYYSFLLSFWSSELEKKLGWASSNFTVVPVSLCSCLDWSCGVGNWIAITGKRWRIVFVKVLLPSNLFLFLSKWIDDLNDAPIKITVWKLFRSPFHLYLKHIYIYFFNFFFQYHRNFFSIVQEFPIHRYFFSYFFFVTWFAILSNSRVYKSRWINYIIYI